MGYKKLGTNWNRQFLDDQNAMFEEIYSGAFLKDIKLSEENLDEGFFKIIKLKEFDFYFGTVNSNTGEVIKNSIAVIESNRIVSDSLYFSKGTTFTNNIPFFNVWINKYDTNKKIVGSTTITTGSSYTTEDNYNVRIVVGTVDYSNFNINKFDTILNQSEAKVLTSNLIEFEKKTDLPVSYGNQLNWKPTSITSDGEYSGYTSNRITSDMIKVSKGVSIKSLDANIKVSFHKYDLNKKYLKYTSGWLPYEKYYTFEEDCYIRFVLSKKDDSTITSKISDKLVINNLDIQYSQSTVTIKNIITRQNLDFSFGSVDYANGTIVRPVNNQIVCELFFLNKNDKITYSNDKYKISVICYDDETSYYNRNNTIQDSLDTSILIEQKDLYRIALSKKDNSKIDNIDDALNGLIIYTSELEEYYEIQSTLFSDFSLGTANYNTGEFFYGGNTRAISNNDFFLKKGSAIKINSLNSQNQLAVYFYTVKDKTFVQAKSMSFGKANEYLRINEDAYIRLVTANLDNSIIDSANELGKKITIRTNDLNTILSKRIIDESNEDISTDFSGSGFNLYQTLTRFYSSIIFDRNRDLWGFTPSKDDHSDTNVATRMVLDNDKKEWIIKNTFTHNWGHVNTANYSTLSDWFIMATGNIGDTADHSKKFWVLENFSKKTSQTKVDISELIEFDTKHFGFKNDTKNSVAIQPVFGEPNDTKNNIIYLLWNDGQTKFISKVLLGVGTTNLGNGTFKSGKKENELNGTMKLLQTFKGGTYIDYVLTQDAIWFNGYIYEMLGHDGLFYNKIKLNVNSSTFTEEQFQEKFYLDNGENLGCVNNGCAILDNCMYTTLTIGNNDPRKTVLVNRILT